MQWLQPPTTSYSKQRVLNNVLYATKIQPLESKCSNAHLNVFSHTEHQEVTIYVCKFTARGKYEHSII